MKKEVKNELVNLTYELASTIQAIDAIWKEESSKDVEDIEQLLEEDYPFRYPIEQISTAISDWAARVKENSIRFGTKKILREALDNLFFGEGETYDVRFEEEGMNGGRYSFSINKIGDVRFYVEINKQSKEVKVLLNMPSLMLKDSTDD